MIFTGAGYIGSVVMADQYNPATFLTCGFLAAAGAGLALKHVASKFPSEEEEQQRWKEQNPWARPQDRVMTAAEQAAATSRLLKQLGASVLALSLGAAAGLLSGHAVMAGVHHFKPQPPPQPASQTQTIKKIEELGYWNRPVVPAP